MCIYCLKILMHNIMHMMLHSALHLVLHIRTMHNKKKNKKHNKHNKHNNMHHRRQRAQRRSTPFGSSHCLRRLRWTRLGKLMFSKASRMRDDARCVMHDDVWW